MFDQGAMRGKRSRAGRRGVWRRAPARRERCEERDCVSQMQLLRERPEVLVRALREMGITENGDEVLEES